MPAYTEEQLSRVPSVDFTQANANESDIEYHLFTNSNQSEAISLEDGLLSKLDPKLPTKVLIHGFTTNKNSPWYSLLKTEYFQRGPHNILYIDWSIAGNLSYAVSSANVDPVGDFISDFLLSTKLPLDNIHLIGHSLGSQLTGFIGKYVFKKSGKKIGRITALDPAGPAFENLETHLRLNPDDANFVDVIHTDIGYYGIIKPIGHVDFYANGGRNQPGCPPHKDNDNCHHARSTLYFVESINNPGTKGKKAKFVENRKIVVNDEEDSDVVFGEQCPSTTRGIYNFETNSTKPFLNSTRDKNV